jgi:2-oxoglutarate ferredoxin oxidoreductase subunit alpha
MTEYAGLSYFAEVPIVVWDVQRVGPSTGLPTRTMQGDLTFVYFLGHGDTNQVILLPGSVDECFDFGWKAFDIAERLQTPVFVLSDLDLGMNNWMTKPFQYPDRPLDRGKVLWEEDLERLKGHWARYKDVDGDAIPYRTVIGNRHPNAAFLTRGTGHNNEAQYSEDPQVWHDMMDRLKRKYETARQHVPGPVIQSMDGAEIGLIAFGSTAQAILEARHQLLVRQGIKTDFMRVRALPFTDEVGDFVHSHAQNYVMELNRDGQLHQLLTLEYPQAATRLISLAYHDGLPLTARRVRRMLLAKLGLEDQEK